MNLCDQHSGFGERLKTLEADIRALWAKWDWMQKTILGVFITLSLNLIGVIALLFRIYVK